MQRNWKYGLMCAVAGLCCFATIAEVDAGIIRRRGNGSTTTVSPTTTTTATTSTRRRGVFGRRRSVSTSSQVTATTMQPATVRGQTPESTQPAAPAR